ncbi:nuclear distribution protein PAC1 [Cryptococcus deuterogattii LA55]|nr:nuclear distribution protein PAC1 [Cryptococcus deuterogattii LA55]KIR95642.1 nuclear distribution protein PAC1 [Cryptococcus deuterogattii CBS 10090]
MLVRPHRQIMGYVQRIHKRQDITRPRPFRLQRTIHARWRKPRFSESRQDHQSMAGLQRLLYQNVYRTCRMGERSRPFRRRTLAHFTCVGLFNRGDQDGTPWTRACR